MISNPVRIRLSDENKALIEREVRKTGADVKDIINARLTESYSTMPCEKLLASLDMDEVMRMENMNTGACSHEIIRFLRRSSLNRVIFAAKPDAFNGYALVMAIEMSDLTVIIDNSSNSLARTPRIMEIENLFQEFFQLGLENKAVFIRERVKKTSDLAPHEALKALYEYEMEPFDLAGYLSVLSDHKFDLKDFIPSGDL